MEVGFGPDEGGAGDERVVRVHPVTRADGETAGALLVARNVGYLDRVQSMVDYSRKLSSFSRLMAGVAHEVKNPLNAMTIHLELLKQKLQAAAGREPEAPPAPDLTRHVATIGDGIRRLDQVMSGLMKFLRPEELHLRPVPLAEALAEVARVVEPEARRASVAVKVDCSADPPDLNADPVMLQQALVNLALNACQAMPGGGTLELKGRAAARRRVEVTVADTGAGIAPDHLARIFDLYFTTKPQGSGIGLSLVYRIVQLHDGEIAVESTPGRGTTFKLTFPRA
jgi:signal transduction histidine kinase